MTDDEKEEYEKMPMFERVSKMLNENQVLAAAHFVRRVDAFMNEFIKKVS
jgi:hypothetical protein